MKQEKIRLLFVCLGNICRSPSAEAVMKKTIADAGLDAVIEVDSAGTNGFHTGEMADARMREHAGKRGYCLDSLSRPVKPSDFQDFDMIIGMDNSNIAELRRRAPYAEEREKIHYMMEFAPASHYDQVPDPYYGGDEGFELVLDLLEVACEGLLDYIKTTYRLS